MTGAATFTLDGVSGYPMYFAIVGRTSPSVKPAGTKSGVSIVRSFAEPTSWEVALGSQSNHVARTAVSDEIPIVVGGARSEDSLIAEIMDFQNLDRGWDGESAEKPSINAVGDAKRFVRDASMISTFLEPTLHVDGSVILEVGGGTGGSLRFKGDGKVIFALEDGRGVSELSDRQLVGKIIEFLCK